MKVNISYAVDLELVPTEVGKLLGNCETVLRSLHADMDMLNVENPLEAIEKISDIRELLQGLDIRLSDCINILSGYVDLQSKVSSGTNPLEMEEVDDGSSL